MRAQPQNLRSRGFIIIALMMILLAITGHARTRQVFFAGGQSNAKAEWASAIESVLKSSGGPDVLVVHQFHPGHWLSNWYITAPQADYTNDFFNVAGTGCLQTQLQAIQAAGDDYVFHGVFWFQGEGDTRDIASIDAYSSRFLGMLRNLRTDLGLTNDFNFTLAVIDASPDPLYDAPTNLLGRTRSDIERIRMVQFNLGATNTGAAVDSRGYARFDGWHLTSAELTRFGTAMGQAYITKFGLPWVINELQLVNGDFESGTEGIVSNWTQAAFETISIPSDPADGAIYKSITTGNVGNYPSQDLIVGSAAGPANYNGILFFPLPNQSFGAASLVLPVITGGILSNANIDLWGLGYVSGTPVLNGNWILNADVDSRTGAVLGTGIGSATPTKIADNIVTQGVTTSGGSLWQTDASQSLTLANFLNSLYTNGAMPGDHAVMRLNPDADVAIQTDGSVGHQNIRYGGSQRVAPDQRSKLRLTLSSRPLIAERSTLTPRTGSAAFRFGLDTAHHATNVIAIRRDLHTGNISGQRVSLTGFARHNSFDPLAANQTVGFQFVCNTISGEPLSVVESVALTSAASPDMYHPCALSGISPTGTVSVTVQIIFRAPDYLTQTSGTALVDDVCLSIAANQGQEFRISGINQLPNGDIELRWASVSNQQYVVLSTSNAIHTPFVELPGIITATGPEAAFTNHPTAGSVQFYRVRHVP